MCGSVSGWVGGRLCCVVPSVGKQAGCSHVTQLPAQRAGSWEAFGGRGNMALTACTQPALARKSRSSAAAHRVIVCRLPVQASVLPLILLTPPRCPHHFNPSPLQGYFYYIFGFAFLVSILTLIITIEVRESRQAIKSARQADGEAGRLGRWPGACCPACACTAACA